MKNIFHVSPKSLNLFLNSKYFLKFSKQRSAFECFEFYRCMDIIDENLLSNRIN